MAESSSTIEYYNNNAQEFAEGTVAVDFFETQEKFCSCLRPYAHVLDFGCGAGRDTICFLKKGFEVDAADGSEKLCEIATRNTGIKVRHMYFSELECENVYDGIWACASILHLPKNELKDVLYRISRALKEEGILYTSFKYGTFEGNRNGRYFTDFTEDTFSEFVSDVPALVTEQCWITSDVRPGRDNEKWLNLIMRKI